MKVELKIPKRYEKLVILSDKEWKDSFRIAFLNALKKAIGEEVAFKSLKRLAKKSKLTDRQVIELGEEVKERVAKRHGL